MHHAKTMRRIGCCIRSDARHVCSKGVAKRIVRLDDQAAARVVENDGEALQEPISNESIVLLRREAGIRRRVRKVRKGFLDLESRKAYRRQTHHSFVVFSGESDSAF